MFCVKGFLLLLTQLNCMTRLTWKALGELYIKATRGSPHVLLEGL